MSEQFWEMVLNNELGTSGGMTSHQGYRSADPEIGMGGGLRGYRSADPEIGMGGGLRAYRSADPEAEIIYGNETRNEVTDTTAAPYKWICQLDLRFPSGTYGGTGTLISPRHVLTCGHNLRGVTRGVLEEATRVDVTPGRNGSTGTSIQASAWYVGAAWGRLRLDNYYDLASKPFDFGLITLSRDVTGGHWGHSSAGAGTTMAATSTSDLSGQTLYVSGYPVEDSPSTYTGRTQVRSQGQTARPLVHTVPSGLMLHTASTMGGNSGSPIWTATSSAKRLVGIHTGPWEKDSSSRWASNRGVLLTSSVLSEVEAWMRIRT